MKKQIAKGVMIDTQGKIIPKGTKVKYTAHYYGGELDTYIETLAKDSSDKELQDNADCFTEERLQPYGHWEIIKEGK